MTHSIVSSPDAILASNSSSYPASQFINSVKRPERVLNTHFYMPPDVRAVEVMSCGRTDPEVIDLLTALVHGRSSVDAR
jgi:3-hydroxybutyryl-CoA dehydrogenase